MTPLAPITLEGQHVRLEPFTAADAAALLPAALHERLWQWTVSQVRTAADLDRYIADALHDQQAGTALPFATIDRKQDRAI